MCWFFLPRPLPHPTEANQGRGAKDLPWASHLNL